jgi:hypothetical protein
MTQYIKKLPAVFQTVTEKKFFDATFDQVLSKKDSDLLNGYLGRRNPGNYNPITDFYLPESNKNRTWWQLEATAFARTEDSTKSNIFFYEDLLNRITSLGGNTLNQDRLFESEYYSWAPPIDVDMFMNYQNYYWIEQGLPAITITGTTWAAIKANDMVTPVGATPAGVTLSSGMTLVLPDDPAYPDSMVIENFGGCRGFELITQNTGTTAGTIYEFLPWDGIIELSTGRVIQNLIWDATTWDTQPQPATGDYITIQRGSADSNSWSTTNRWFNIQTISQAMAITNTTFPQNATRGLRPIIQFIADLVLYPLGNTKVSVNQAPLFQLYDHEGIELDNVTTYPNSTFAGSKIFSYKENTVAGASIDSILKFPLTYGESGQTTDIIFQNNLITDRYTYNEIDPVAGYYYYRTISTLADPLPLLFNNWNLYNLCDCADISPTPPANCIEKSKQRVIDKFVVGYGTQYQFRLSVTPYGYTAGGGTVQPASDIIVSVNDKEIFPYSIANTNGYTLEEINNEVYVVLSSYLTNLLTITQSRAPVVEVQTYTHSNLNPEASGYFEIPQQLEANPNQEEVGDIGIGSLIQQFSSIISNQIGFAGTAFGGNNNYSELRKNRSIGSYILQNTAPLLKAMLVSSSDDLDFIIAERFSQDEYTKFKNKFLRVAKQLIDQGFNPTQLNNGTILTSEWVGEIIRILGISKEFSSAFAYSHMIANGAPDTIQNVSVPALLQTTLANYADLLNVQNALYVYNTTGTEKILMIGRDYTVATTSTTITVDFIPTGGNVAIGDSVYFYIYKNPLPAYIPSTPTKLGMYQTYIPRTELDTSYAIPSNVIIGHDGSKTIAYGDYRDNLLLDLETRIYNLLNSKFHNQYTPPVRLESVKPGYFRQTRYSRQEFLDITESYLNKWSAKNKANYRANDWVSASAVTPVNQLWKLYNYSAVDLPGNWKGIYQYYYDTIFPNTRPWEMLGFSSQPSWWTAEYGTDYTPTNAHMWADLENGIIRQGPTAIYNPVTGLPQEQPMWARPGLAAIIPVDALGDIVPVPALFSIPIASDYAPFDYFDADWKYGDGSPVEQAWMSTSGYAFTVQEFLYLMKPAEFGELLWDTVGTELSPGMISDPTGLPPGIDLPVRSSVNWQYVQNDQYTNDDPFFTWMRPKNKDQLVHAESIDGVIQVRYGYQRWISDRVLFLGMDVTSTFGQKIRTLDVNLANKFGGFTNKDTSTTYIESVTSGATNSTLLVPSNNFDVILHKSPPVDTYAYSGIVVRSLADGTFVIYGYDLQNSEFITLDRSNAKLIDITIGGTPDKFSQFISGETYNKGDIVRYNGVFYLAVITHVATKFTTTNWQKLRALPIAGGISVTYKPVSESTITKYPYGSILKSAQEVFDLMIGWGAYLESRGWDFTDVNQDTNIVSDWLYSAKQFLFWLNTAWAPDAAIQLSPLANTAKLTVKTGYPNDVENIYNGVYSILDKFGVAIPTDQTVTDRDGQTITVSPVDVSAGGIFFLQVSTSETEHVLIFDNSTNFGDVVYSPLLRTRQQRLRFNGFRSNGWYGKMEAPGYLVIDNQLVPNFDTIVEAMRYYYDPNITIDNPSLEDLGRHLIGYESKSYLDNLELANDVQYLFYQGAIRQKGTKQAFDKLFRSTKIQNDDVIEVYEEWALKVGDFGNTVEQVSTEFKLQPEQNTGEVIVARLNFVASSIGMVKQINILNATQIYKTVPIITIASPDTSIVGWRQAKAYAVLDSIGRISRVDISDSGYGYLSAPSVIVSTPISTDELYAVWQGEIIKDTSVDNIINIDIDQTDVWTVRPTDPEYALEFPVTPQLDYPVPNAGYVNFDDVDLYSFDAASMKAAWGSRAFNPVEDNTLWIANTFTQDWGVYNLVKYANDFAVVDAGGGNLQLLTKKTDPLITPQFSTTGETTDFGNMLVMQVIEATATAVIDSPGSQAAGTVDIIGPTLAELSANVAGGGVISLTIVEPGSGYLSLPAITTITIDPPVKEDASMSCVVVNGVVTTVNIDNGGMGYDQTGTTVVVTPPVLTNAFATATVIGNEVTELTLTNPGSGYAVAPTVVIDSPRRQAVASAEISGGLVTGVSVINNGSGYLASVTTSISIDPPIPNTATATVIIGGVSGTGIESITMTNQGAGYISTPGFTIISAGGPGVAANISPIIASGKVTGFSVTSQGSGYILPVTIIIDAPPAGVTATGTATIIEGKVSEIIITNPGTSYISEPQITIDPPTGITPIATATIANGTVATVSYASAGLSGYAFIPTVTIDQPTGVVATFVPTVVDGIITGHGAISGGTGYTSIPAITVSKPNGVQAQGVATIVSESIFSVSTVGTEGSGYVSAPNVTVSSPTGAGRLTNPVVTDGGFGYSIPPIIAISGDGAGATAHTVLTGDKVTSIVIDTVGLGYTSATLVIAPPDGIIGDIILDKVGSNYTVVPEVEIIADLLDFTGAGAEAIATIAGGVVTGITITNRGSGYTFTPTVKIKPPTTIGGSTNFALGFSYNSADSDSDLTYYHYDLLNIDDTNITSDEIADYVNFTNLMLFKTMRFAEISDANLIGTYVSLDDKVWIDGIAAQQWSVKKYVSPGVWTDYRVQEDLINSSLFQSASVFSTNTQNELVRLPVYDPFKNILPGMARQNISYMSLQDPARYNITSNDRLRADTITFGPAQVGKLWWDLSQTKYVYYEQPIALDARPLAEREIENLVYRRDQWGQIFPGSTVAIYEWVQSDVVPTEYTGTGTPRDVTSYVQLVTSNRFTDIVETKYYFWVLNTTDKPNTENRTLAALETSRLLQSPKSQGYAFFAPIQQTATNNSYMFFNVQEILAYQGNNIQIQYRVTERNDQQHTQWAFFREGDTSSFVTDQFWNKMVDSLCAYTRPLPLSDEYSNSIDMGDGTEILPVPDPTLSSGEKYGVQYRPRQSMFTNLANARKIFTQSANSLLQYIPIRDTDPSWNADIATSIYWIYTNWVEVGYETTTPDYAYQTLAEASAAITNIAVGKIVKVLQGTADGRYVYYVVEQLNPNVAVKSYKAVTIENSAIKLLDTIYSVQNVYGLSTELRALLNAFRSQVMIDSYIVDQNELFFSMLNYVVSEQRNPDWVFKSSYIFVKENNKPLSQSKITVPSQISNVIAYITDSKPYHTQVRDYTSTYNTADTATGTVTEGIVIESIDYEPWDENLTLAWESTAWDNTTAPVVLLNLPLPT